MPLQPFLEKLKNDDDFRHHVYKEVLPGLTAAARAEGFDVSEEAYHKMLDRHKERLTDEQLEAVSGGCNCRWIEECDNGGDYLVGN